MSTIKIVSNLEIQADVEISWSTDEQDFINDDEIIFSDSQIHKNIEVKKDDRILFAISLENLEDIVEQYKHKRILSDA